MENRRDAIIKEIQRLAHEKGVNLIKRSDFTAETGISSYQIYNAFDGWREACKLAGLDVNDQNIPISNNDLFEEMRRVFLSIGNVCNKTKFQRESKYSSGTYKKRFGRWQDVLWAFRQWLELEGIEFPFIDKLPAKSIDIVKVNNEPKSPEIPYWPGIPDTTYGPFLNFPGLQHAPLNELGVVFLFGMVCDKLGYVVESIRSSYPDCEAKRRIDNKRDNWEKVKVEFEFRSSSFKEHGHNSDLCNVIVCWEDDWLECPLEVLELRSVIKSLM